jgi:hypothetical protein
MKETCSEMNKARAVMKTTTLQIEKQAVSGEKLLEIIFPPECRPTLRWLRDQQKTRRIPFVKIGRLVFFFPDQVRDALLQQQTKARI